MFEFARGVLDPRANSHSPIWQPSQYRAELIISHSIVVAYAIYMLRGFVPGSPISIVYKPKRRYCSNSQVMLSLKITPPCEFEQVK